jgi:predicted AAA+ superfamily ATPase
MGIIARALLPQLQAALNESRVVALLGARQVGKSTLVRSLCRAYYSLDDLATRSTAERDPTGFVRSLPAGAAIDEVQRVPEVLLAIKSVVDLDPSPGQFMVTGSANILTLPTIADSLAGRMRIFELQPFAEVEIESTSHNAVDRLFDERLGQSEHFSTSPQLVPDLIGRLTRGGYPEVVRLTHESSRAGWFSDYLLAIIQREVREIARIGNVADMERLMRILAVRSGQILSPTKLSSEIEIPKETLRRYTRILEQLYLVHALPAWSGDPGRRYIKGPKLFINDVGLAVYELGADAQRLAKNHDLLGNLTETFVVNEIRKHASWSMTRPRLFHLRTSSGTEVDLILEARDGRRVAIEIKLTASPGPRDTRALRDLVSSDQHIVRGVLFCAHEQALQIAERVYLLPIPWLWQNNV